MAKTSARARGKSIDKQYLGAEPDLSGKTVATQSQLAVAYSWYNYFYDADDAKAMLLEYLKAKKSDKKTIEAIRKAVPVNVRTAGWIARILTQKGNVPETTQAYFQKVIDTHKLVQAPVLQEKVVEEPAKNVVSIQDRINEKFHDLAGEINDHIDSLFESGKTTFEVKAWLANRAIKPDTANRIAAKFKPLYSELFDTVNAQPRGQNSDLAFAYRYVPKKRLKEIAEFVRNIIQACEASAIAGKMVRKPRKKKEKPAAVVVAKMKYQEKDDSLSLVSVKPTEILGAQQVWILNTKTRAITVFNAMGPVGLGVKGSTIFGFDEKLSSTKKVRANKLDKVLKEIKEGGKVSLRRVMENISSQEKQAKGRINKDTILVRAIR